MNKFSENLIEESSSTLILHEKETTANSKESHDSPNMNMTLK